jgi:hypothetical protein
MNADESSSGPALEAKGSRRKGSVISNRLSVIGY